MTTTAPTKPGLADEASDWLDALAPGDAVIVVRTSFSREVRAVGRVARRSKTHIVVGYDGFPHLESFSAYDGRGIGHRFHRPYLEQPTPEALARVEEGRKRLRFLNAIETARWSSLSTRSLARIAGILDEEAKGQPEETGTGASR